MKRCLIVFLLLVAASAATPLHAQRISTANMKLLHSYDDSLQDYGDKMLDEQLATDRLRADSMFTRLLVKALRVPNSFYFQFDSMQMAPVLYPADSSFRIITWHIPMNDDGYRQKGAIQMNTSDGSLKLFPLFDISDYSDDLLDSIRGTQNWVGAVYYKIIEHAVGNQKVYTLLGYDENSDLTSRKWIDILRFDQQGEPRWGGDFFLVKNDSIFPPGSKRYLVEYKKEGRAHVNYDEEDSLIVMDHLVSETGEPEKRYTLIPGGDYEAFKWENDHWTFIDKLYMQNAGDGNEPKPMTILDDNGNANEDALMKQSEKNIEKAQEQEKKQAASQQKKNEKAPPKKSSKKGN